MASRQLARQAERAYEAYLQHLGYVTQPAQPKYVVLPGRQFPITTSNDLFRAFDVIAIGPRGFVFSQVSMAESRLFERRDKVGALPWPTTRGRERAEVVYAERVRHPTEKRRKAWRFTIQLFDFETRSWPRRDHEQIEKVIWDDTNVVSVAA